MQLSEDGKTLLSVSEEDIDNNGAVVIPEGLTSLGRQAFFGLTTLTQITLPEGLTSIGQHALYDCTGLTQISFPEGLTSISIGAFGNCAGLTQITLPEGLTSIGGLAFSRCTGLTQITLPEGLASIGEWAFIDCDRLEKIIINTNSDEELARIKALLPSEHRDKVIKNPVYSEVLEFQNGMLEQIKKIKGLVGDEHLPFKQAIAKFSFPTSIESFAKYKEEVTDFIKAKKQQINAAVDLQEHLDHLNKMKVKKETKAPGFFIENPNSSLKEAQKIVAISKAINYLKGETDLTFSPEEMAVLNKGFAKDTLESFDITLPLVNVNDTEDRRINAKVALDKITDPIKNIINASGGDNAEKIFARTLLENINSATNEYIKTGGFKAYEASCATLLEDTLKNITEAPSWANEGFIGLLKQIANVIHRACTSSNEPYYKTSKHQSADDLAEAITTALSAGTARDVLRAAP